MLPGLLFSRTVTTVALDARQHLVVVLGAEGDVIHRSGALARRGHERDTSRLLSAPCRFPIRRCESPACRRCTPSVPGNPSGGRNPLCMPSDVDVEVARGVDVVGQDEVVFEFGEWHGSP